MATRTEEVITLVEKISAEKDERISELEDENDELKVEVEEANTRCSTLSNEYDELLMAPDKNEPNTILGELKREIVEKFMHLDIELLKKLEKEHCDHLLGIEVNQD